MNDIGLEPISATLTLFACQLVHRHFFQAAAIESMAANPHRKICLANVFHYWNPLCTPGRFAGLERRNGKGVACYATTMHCLDCRHEAGASNILKDWLLVSMAYF